MKRFKMSFGCCEVAGPGLARKQRALIIAVSTIPGGIGWVNAVLACEDGSMQTKAIPAIDFEMSKRRLVTLVETEEEKAAPVIYSADLKS